MNRQEDIMYWNLFWKPQQKTKKWLRVKKIWDLLVSILKGPRTEINKTILEIEAEYKKKKTPFIISREDYETTSDESGHFSITYPN